MKRASVVMPMQLPSVANMREHWAKKAARVKAQRTAAYTMLLTIKRPALWPPLVITLTRIAPRTLDRDDNLNISMKAVRDGVADWLAIDDGSDLLTWRYAQRKGLPKEHAVQIDVEDAA